MAANANLHKAKDAKNDEFYTQLTDVSKELMHYKQHFKDKIVLCNCDDPTWSAFWKYFHLNFSALGLKKLISTHYDKNEPTYKMEYTGGDDNDIEVGVKTLLEGNGDFRNQECLDLLDEADIVVTNPPFSLFREYVAILMEHEKKFIIWGNNNAITYKEFFPLLKENKVWLGYTANKTLVFRIPDSYTKWDEKETQKMNDGHHYAKVPAISVFTNLDIDKRHEKIILWKKYNPEEYPKYDNYEAIEVSKIADIPVDYDGVMGVPITYMDKANPDQFEIIGADEAEGIGFSNGLFIEGSKYKQCYANGSRIYKRIFIRRKDGNNDGDFRIIKSDIISKERIDVMAANANLHKAKNAKNDEFYTQLTDVSKELMHYKQHFKDKIVFCNCDDPTWSAFWKYFHLNFSALGLKKLISTHYDKTEPTYKMEYEGGDDNNIEVGVKTLLEGNGDFRNQECLDLLDECDIVVTNPPFSLFREYVDVLMKHKKKFLIIGNNNAITYKEFFPLLKENKVWLGYTANKTLVFRIPDSYAKWDEKETQKMNDGNHYAKVPAISVFTNLDIAKRHEKLILWKHYTPEEYPKYDNYDAINVDKVTDIPCDYDGVMGVPITFLDKYNPDQFEIIELGNSRDNFTPNKDYINPKKHLKDGKITNGGAINCVLAIEQDAKPVNTVYYTSDNSKYLVPPYARILIRKKAGA